MFKDLLYGQLLFLADKKWTHFDAEGYEIAINSITKWSVLNNQKFWEVEKYWWP